MCAICYLIVICIAKDMKIGMKNQVLTEESIMGRTDLAYDDHRLTPQDFRFKTRGNFIITHSTQTI